MTDGKQVYVLTWFDYDNDYTVVMAVYSTLESAKAAALEMARSADSDITTPWRDSAYSSSVHRDDDDYYVVTRHEVQP